MTKNSTSKIMKNWTILSRLFPVREFKLTEVNNRIARLLQERRAELNKEHQWQAMGGLYEDEIGECSCGDGSFTYVEWQAHLTGLREISN